MTQKGTRPTPPARSASGAGRPSKPTRTCGRWSTVTGYTRSVPPNPGSDSFRPNQGGRRPGNAATVASLMHSIDHFRRARLESVMLPEELGRVSIPARFCIGSADPFLGPDQARPSIGHMPLGELREVQGGHAPWLEAPAEIGPTRDRALRRALEGHTPGLSKFCRWVAEYSPSGGFARSTDHQERSMACPGRPWRGGMLEAVSTSPPRPLAPAEVERLELRAHAAGPRQAMTDARVRARARTRREGEDPPEIRDWTWPN